MGKRGDSLRNLVQKKLEFSELDASLINAVGTQNPRNAIIVLGAILENLLERIIRAKLKTKSPDLLGQLFKERGPLSDFHSKILVCQAFDLIRDTTAHDLMIIKSIRNVFAHSPTDVSFETPEIKSEIERLNDYKLILEVTKTRPFKDFASCFAFTMIIIHSALQVDVRVAEGQKPLYDE